MAAREEYCGEECPRCLGWAGEGSSACPVCGHAVPLTLVFPYDDPPWEYTDEVVNRLRGYRGLRLMARYSGRRPERLAELGGCQRLYLSRYQGFRFELLGGFDALESFELDSGPIVDLEGAPKSGAAVLKLTECRKLVRLDALAGCSSVKLLSLALCNAVTDHSPIGSMKGLQSLFIEAREIASLEFLSPLRNLRSVALGADRIAARDIEPLFGLDALEHLAIRKRLVEPGDVERMRDRWPKAQIVVD